MGLASAKSSGINKAAVAKALTASDKAAAGAKAAAKHAKKMAALSATATNVSNSAASAHEDAMKADQLASQGAFKSKAAAMRAHKSYDEFVKEGHAYGYVH